jgi:uncharacterized protein
MQLTLENPDFRYLLRGASGSHALVNEQRLERSFILAPNSLVEDWRPRLIGELLPEDLDEVLRFEPAVVLLGSGERLSFPSPAVMAACLTRGIGIEVMDNAAAARTFNVLATEGRRVVAAFLIG